MAKGDFIWFSSAKVGLGNGLHQLGTHVFKFALIRGAANGGIDPGETLADPRWGTGGGTDLSAIEATVGGNYPADGIVLANSTWGANGPDAVWDSDNVLIAVDPANPSDASWGIVYNDTIAGKQAIGLVDLGGVVDMTQGPFEYTVPVAGWMSLA